MNERGSLDRGRRRGSRSRVLAPVALLAVAALVGGVVACGSLTPPAGQYQSAFEAPATDLEAVARPEPKRVLIFGDSIAAQAGGHAKRALEQAGVEVKVIGLWGQGLFTREQYDMGHTNPAPPSGSVMTAADKAIAEFRPDIVAVSLNHNYWPPYPRDAQGVTIERGSEAFADMARAQITELNRRLTVNGAKVYLVDPIPEGAHEGADRNPIWSAYLSTQDDLGFGVIHAGGVVAGPDGGRVEEMPDCRGGEERVRPADDIHLTYFGAGKVATTTARALADLLGVPSAGIEAPTQAPVALTPMGTGYRIVTCDGATFRFGAGGAAYGALTAGAWGPDAGSGSEPAGQPDIPVPVEQDPGSVVPAGGAAAAAGPATPMVSAGPTTAAGAPDPVVSATATPDGRGEWLVTASGRVAALGTATAGGDAPIAGDDRAVGIAAAPNGTGYWVATATGKVFALGGAEDAGGLDTGESVVAISSAPSDGYWLLTDEGRVVAFAGAESFGGLAREAPPGGVVAVSPDPSGGGYWVLDRTGAVHPFGTAKDFGSAADQPFTRVTRFASTADFDTARVPASDAPTDAVGLLPTSSGEGYWVLLGNGAVCSFGDAQHIGGIHRSEVDEVLLLKGLEYYGDGPCQQDAGFGPPNQPA